MTSEIKIRAIPDIAQVHTHIVDIYRTVFALPPYSEPPEMADAFRQRLLDEHARRDGFRFLVALHDSRMIGFAYGYHSAPGQFWHDNVREALDQNVAADWMEDAFEFVELAVLPNYQGSGTGSRLQEELLHDLPERTAIATTVRDDNPALGFYLRRGWKPLRDDFYFPGVEIPQVIIGRRLHPAPTAS